MGEKVQVAAREPEAKRDNPASHIRNANKSQSINSPVGQVLYLQRTIGNQAVQRLISSATLQTKPNICPSGDKYEQEADRVADAVMRMPEPMSAVRLTKSQVLAPVIQRLIGCAEESLSEPVAVRYGPEYLPYQENDIYGVIFDVEVISAENDVDDLYHFEEREQLSDSFDHSGSFQHVRGGRPLPFSGNASGWQRASSVYPDSHGLSLSLITEAAETGTGSFAINQLDIYKRTGRADSTARVIQESGFKVVYSVITNPLESTEGSIILHVDKIPERCSVGVYGAEAGRGGVVSGQIYIRGGRTFRGRGHSHILLRSKRDVRETVASSPEINKNFLGISGMPLPRDVRAFFEPRFRYDFSQVRIHSDRYAAESAQMVNARAFTTGQDIVFATGQYAPWSNEGQRLLAHELTHVIQQRKAAKNWIQAYRVDAYPSNSGAEFRGLAAYAEHTAHEGHTIAFPVTNLSDLHSKMNEEKQRRISDERDYLVNELHLYGHGQPGQLQIGGVNYTQADLRGFDETFEDLMNPGATIFAESCLSAQGEEGWELFRQLGRVFFGNRNGWLQGNTQPMNTIGGPIEARARLFRYPHDFSGDFRAADDVEDVLRFSLSDEEFLRNIDIDDSQLGNALRPGRSYMVRAVSNTSYRSGDLDFFVKFTIYPRTAGRFLHASDSARWEYLETLGPSWTFRIARNGEYILNLRIWTTQRPGSTNGDPSAIPESDRLTLKVIRRPLNVGYPRI